MDYTTLLIMKITKQLTKKYCHFVVFSLALALAAPFLSCSSGGGGDGNGNQGPGEVPSVPQNFKAENPSDSDGPITLTWDPVAGEGVTYDLFFSETRGFTLEDGTKIPDVTSPYLHQMGIMQGTPYYYRLTANNSVGASEPANEVWGIIPLPGRPETPQNFMAEASTRQVTLTWDPVAGEGVTYDLFFSETREFTLEDGTKISDVTSPYTHDNLMDGTTYYYRLTANDSAGGASAPTAEVSATTLALPATPQNFNAVASEDQVTLTWDTGDNGVTYKLFRSLEQDFTIGNETKISDDAGSPYIDNMGLESGTRYYYRLTANNSAGASAPTDAIWVIIPEPGVPETPQNFKAEASTRQVTLTWDTQSDVTYELFFSTSMGFILDSAEDSFSNVTSPYTHDNLTHGITHYYRLTAKNSVGASSPTSEVSATTLPATPQNFMAVGSTRQVTLTWDTQSDVTYDLFFSTSMGFTVDSAEDSFSGVTSPYIHDNLSHGITYYYLLTAANSSGASIPTSEVSATTLPATPHNFQAVGSTKQVTLTWDTQSDVTYELFFSTSMGFTVDSAEDSFSGVTSPYFHDNLTHGTTYYYLLTAVNSSGASMPTDETSALTLPATPQNFQAVGSTRQVRLTWDTQSDVTYDLFFSTSMGFTVDSAEGSFSGVTSPYIHDNLSHGTTYYYLLTAVNSSGASVPTSEVSALTLLGTPGGFMATPLDKQVRLTWDAQSDITYELFFSTSMGFTVGSAEDSFSGVTSPYTHENLTNGTPYYYLLTANNSAGMSIPTSEASATPAPAPETPEGFKAIPLDGQVRLTWDSQEGVTYELFDSTSMGFTVDSAEGSLSGVSSPYIHDNLNNGTTYYYLLRGSNPAGASMPTDEVSATPAPPPDMAPANFEAAGADKGVELTWDSQTSVTYELFFSESTGFTVDNAEGSFENVTSPYTHENLKDDTTYYYLLRAVNPAGVGPPTAEVSAKTLLAKPENFVAVASDKQVTLTWGVQDDITSYDLYHSTTSGFSLQSGTKEPNVMPPYQHSNLTNGIRLYYRLVANGPSNMSASADAAGTPYIAKEMPAGRLSAGRRHTCALMDELVDRRVKCWGDLRDGQLGDGRRGVAYRPLYAGNITTSVTQVSAGDDQVCVVLGGGALCWGGGDKGQLGDGMKVRRTTPVQPGNLTAGTGVTQISAGWRSTCALVSGGVFCWGENDRGQLGSGDNTEKLVPHQVVGLTVSGLTVGALTAGVTQIAVGSRQACAVVNGRALCWGEGAVGQLGNGLEETVRFGGRVTRNRKNTPQQVVGLTEGVTQISMSSGHTCAVVNGGAFCWGAGYFGRLGSGDNNAHKLVPHQVVGLTASGLTVGALTSGVTQISAGSAHTCAVVDGRALCWGRNDRGQLGTGNTLDVNTPQQVVGLTEGVAEISTGDEHTCALLQDGRFLCWGRTILGGLGNNVRTDGNVLTPVPVQN